MSTFYRSAVYSLGAEVVTSALGMGRIVVVARLLAPDELGRFFLVAAVMAGVERASSPGFHDAIIQRPRRALRTYQAAWTVLVLRGAVLTLLVVIAAEPIATLLGHPDIAGLLRVASLVLVIRSFMSLSVLLAERDVDLRPAVSTTVAAQLNETIISILAVAVTGSVWGLIMGLLARSLTEALVSHRFRDAGFRPGIVLSWSEIRDLVAYARWRFVSHLLWYVNSQGDDLLVGRLLGTGPLSLYRISYRLAHLPTSAVAFTTARVAFPALSRHREGSDERAQQSYLRYLTVTSGLAAPVAALLAATAEPFVLTLLGPPYAAAAVPLAVMSAGGFLYAIITAGAMHLLSTGRPALETAMQALRAVVLVGGLLLLVRFGVVGAAMASFLSVLAMLPVWLYGMAQTGMRAGTASAAVLRRLIPGSGAGIAAWAVVQLASGPAPLLLLAGVLTGAVVWFAFLLVFDRTLLAELRLLYGRLRTLVVEARKAG